MNACNNYNKSTLKRGNPWTEEHSCAFLPKYIIIGEVLQCCSVLILSFVKIFFFFFQCEAVFSSCEEAGCERGHYKHQGEFGADTTGEEV